MKPYVIRVKGDIIANDLVHYAQDWVCYGGIQNFSIDATYSFDRATHSVNGSLLLNSNIRAVPYAIYVAEQGISCMSTGDICASLGAHAAHRYYIYNMSQVKRQLLIDDINTALVQPLYRGLYTDVFSILELFLSDFLLCIIYSKEDVYSKAMDFYQLKKKSSNEEVIDLERKMHDFFFQGVIYHQFDVVGELFEKIVGIKIPCYAELKTLLHKRNNIAHRYSLSNIDRMRVSFVEKQDIQRLIDCTDRFVASLMELWGKIYRG